MLMKSGAVLFQTSLTPLNVPMTDPASMMLLLSGLEYYFQELLLRT